MIQVQLSLCIIYSTGSFFDQDWGGNTIYTLTLSSATFILSLGASSFGMAKFFLKGPISLLPQTAPLGGLLSLKFLAFVFLHIMFTTRTITLEHALLSSYRQNKYGSDYQEPIETVIP